MTPAPSSNPSFDPGLTRVYTGPLLRAINKDGSFNVQRTGLRGCAGDVYIHLVSTPWPRFLVLLTAGYLVVNAVFAAIFLALGPDSLHATERSLGLGQFGLAFFFSVQTLTTVGYGSVYPAGVAANIVAGTEAAVGLMGFALATGLLFARFSRPSSKLIFSETMVVAPSADGSSASLQFRIANQRSNVLMDVEARLMLSTVERGPTGEMKRNFQQLPLEVKQINFLALTWTVVHAINADSPLHGKTHDELKDLQAEVMILIKGFDDSFSQVVHTRYSYRWDEIQWSARFAPAFTTAPEGHMVLHVGKVGNTVKV
jgi:inward rectifier potassium channel